jgi:hypothetical protein
LSVLGHVEDIHKWLIKFADTIPISDEQIGQWLEEMGKWLNKSFPESKDTPSLAEVFKPTGVLWIARRPLSQDIKYRPYLSHRDRALMYELEIPSTERQLLKGIESNKIQLTQALFVNEIKCSKCKADYRICPHSKYLDHNVYAILHEFELAFPFWTDRKA